MKIVEYGDLARLAGEELGASNWFEIDQRRVDKFADLTEDYQWIHVDVDRAAAELGGTIVHGFLTMSLLTRLSQEIWRVEGISRQIYYGLNKLRFISPITVGSRVRARQKLLNVYPKGEGLMTVTESVTEIEGGDRPACMAEMLSLWYPAHAV